MQTAPHNLRANVSSLHAMMLPPVVTTHVSIACNTLVVPDWCSDYPAAPPAAGGKATNGAANGQTVV